MDNHAGRLVEDDQMGILEADIERQGLRDRRWILILGEEYYEVLAAADAHSRIALRLPLAHDVTGLDQPFQSCARQGRQMVCERAIEAQAGVTGTGTDSGRGSAGDVGSSGHIQPLPIYVAPERRCEITL